MSEPAARRERSTGSAAAACGRAMERAYAPYSRFRVGVAGLVDDGRIVAGCNVENAAYGVALCAECGMVSELHATGGGRWPRSSASAATAGRSCRAVAAASCLGERRAALPAHDARGRAADVGGAAPGLRGRAPHSRRAEPAPRARRRLRP